MMKWHLPQSIKYFHCRNYQGEGKNIFESSFKEAVLANLEP